MQLNRLKAKIHRVTVTHAYQFGYLSFLGTVNLTGRSTMREQGASVAGACP